MTELQDALRADKLTAQVVGDVTIRLPVTGIEVPLRFDSESGEAGVYLAFVAAERLGAGAAAVRRDRPGPRRPRPLAAPLTGDAAGLVHCLHCLDTGHVCEDHPDMPWEGFAGTVEGHAEHGGVGMPCGHCCSPIPEDGRHSIVEAFTPDWRR